MLSIQNIYHIAIEMGIEADPRGKAGIAKYLTRLKKDFDSLNEHEKKGFDTELLENPFSDTRILYGHRDQPISKVFVGIDIGVGELLLVDRLNERGAEIELLIAHHPEGSGITCLHQVMALQADVFYHCGVPVSAAEQILWTEAAKTKRSLAVINYNQVVDAARLLNLPLMCVHTPADNLVQQFTEQLLEQYQPETIAELLELLNDVPEYHMARQAGAGPQIFVGQAENRMGKVMVDMTGGADAGKDIYARLGSAGIGTVIAMHMVEETRKELEKQWVNVVLAGHMSSDSIGMNLLLDRLELQGMGIITGAGLTRFSRNSNDKTL